MTKNQLETQGADARAQEPNLTLAKTDDDYSETSKSTVRRGSQKRERKKKSNKTKKKDKPNLLLSYYQDSYKERIQITKMYILHGRRRIGYSGFGKIV